MHRCSRLASLGELRDSVERIFSFATRSAEDLRGEQRMPRVHNCRGERDQSCGIAVFGDELSVALRFLLSSCDL